MVAQGKTTETIGPGPHRKSKNTASCTTDMCNRKKQSPTAPRQGPELVPDAEEQ